MVVMKFGGTSVKDAAALSRVAAIVARERERRPSESGPVVVVSAMAGVTDALLAAAEAAASGLPSPTLIETLRSRHAAVAATIRDEARRSALERELDEELAELTSLLRALVVLRDVSPRSRDALAATGEVLSSRVAAAVLADAGIPTAWVDARAVLVTDQQYGGAQPLLADTRERLDVLVRPRLAAGEVVVMGGFMGATREGVTTTLGRGGSDYSAAIFGAGLDASEIQIWTDVDGMLTADPRVIEGAHVVPTISFAEASELAYFGAKVLHPSTILPAVAQQIPVRILNSLRPDGPGTLIATAGESRTWPLASLACKRQVTVIDVTSTRMLMAYGFLRRLFEVFERYRTPVDVVTTSEVSVSVTIDDRRNLEPIVQELSGFADVACDHDMAIVCAVGEQLRTDPALFAVVIGTLEGLPLRMVSQAGARRNITIVLPESCLAEAVRRLHRRFFETAAPGAPADLVAGRV